MKENERPNEPTYLFPPFILSKDEICPKDGVRGASGAANSTSAATDGATDATTNAEAEAATGADQDGDAAALADVDTGFGLHPLVIKWGAEECGHDGAVVWRLLLGGLRSVERKRRFGGHRQHDPVDARVLRLLLL